MFAKLTQLVSSGYSFPYTLGQPFGTSWGSWTHYRGTAKDDGSPVSIFRISASNKNDPKLVAARNGAKRLKLLRHPNTLAFKDTHELEEKGETAIYLVTEPVTPLVEALQTLDVAESQRNDYIAMGLYHMSNAVSFLNNDCKLIHGNVCLAAVVVTESLDWKLHGFDLVTEHQWQGDLALVNASWMVGSQYKPAEVAKGDWQSLRDNPPWAVDAWGLGCLMQEAFAGKALTATEDLRNTECIPQPVLQYYQRLLASQPSRRLNPIKLLESAVFKTKLVETVAFLENLAVKDVVEKETFFKRLPQALPSLSKPVAERKILPLLAGALEFGGAPPVALTTLLQIGMDLKEEDYQKKVVPTLSKLFASTDRNIRKSLLENISTYGKVLTQQLVEEQIYPSLSTGFTDSTALLRELTLKSMLVLAPKLTQRTINQSLLKFLAKLQVDDEPSIRANTTILLGNLAEHLSESTCKRVLLNAFTRALKDPFPPARVAGLKAMGATAKYYNSEEAATRVIPLVAPLAIDPVPDVRQAALQILEVFIDALRDNSTTMQNGAPVATPAAAAPAELEAANATWGSWAMSSFGLANKPPTGAASKPMLTTTSITNATPLAPTPSTSTAPASKSSDTAIVAEGWDDDLDIGIDAEEQAARQRLSKLTTSSRPSASATHKSRASASSEGWDDPHDVLEPMADLGAGSLTVPQSDGLDGLMAEVASKSKSGPAGRPIRAGGRTGATRTSTTGQRKTAGKSMKLGATKVANKTLIDDWGADDF